MEKPWNGLRILAVISQKGGVGKTNAAAHLAVSAATCGLRVGLVDLDDQASLTDWYSARQVGGVELINASATDLAKGASARRAFEAAGYDLVVLDTPPSHSNDVAIRAAITAANFVLVPCQPSPTDIRAISRTVAMLKDAAARWAFLLSYVPARSSLNDSARAELAKHGDLFPGVVSARTAFKTAMISGSAVIETEPKGKAAEEIKQLWAYVIERIK